jgi:hypothetical protein
VTRLCAGGAAPPASMRRGTFFLLLAGAMAAGPADARPQITSDAKPGVDFAGYRTFAWVNPGPAPGANPVVFQRIRTGIENALAKKGYQEAKGDAGDLSLAVSTGAQDKTQIEHGGYYDLQTYAYQYTEGTLSLVAFDTKTKQAIWRGQATETVNRTKPDYRAIDDGVTKMMAMFPAGGGAAPAQATPR